MTGIAGPYEVTDSEEWNSIVADLNGGHLLQSWQWGDLKARYGWSPRRIIWEREQGQPAAAAQLLFRTLGGRWTIGYCPRGPLLDWDDESLPAAILSSMATAARERGAIFLKIDPHLVVVSGSDEQAEVEQAAASITSNWAGEGWRASGEQIQFKNTMQIDLEPDEETLLMGMKQKTRYNVRLAGRRGVVVRQGSLEDLELLYRMYAETSVRDGFVIRDPAYYEHAWGSFIKAGFAQPLIAEFEDQAVAAVIIYRFGAVAYYLYGMSINAHREKMPNYLLQWEAMRWAKSAGCTRYDLWGAPDVIDPQDPMYGVYRFKDGFGARLVRTPGAWDLPLRPALFALYSGVMPLMLSFMRTLGRRQTKQSIDA